MKKSYKITIPDNKKFLLPIKLRFDNNNNNHDSEYKKELLNINENTLLNYFKNKINLPNYNKYWVYMGLFLQLY